LEWWLSGPLSHVARPTGTETAAAARSE